MENLNLEKIKLEVFDALKHDFRNITVQYWNLLKCIYLKISNNKGIYQRKFNEVRYEFYQFLKMHKTVASLKSFTCVNDVKNCIKYDFGCLDSVETFLNYDKFVNYSIEVGVIRKNNPSENQTVETIDFTNNKSDIFEFLEQAKMFTKNGFSSNYNYIQFSDGKKWKSKQFSYGELFAKNEIRYNDIFYSVVSKERIAELSFTFENTNKDLLSDIACSICQEKFEIDQELSRMPCGDFFHKNCIAQWFNIPDDYFVYDSDSESDLRSESGSNSEFEVYLNSEPDLNPVSEVDLDSGRDTEPNYLDYESDNENNMYYDIEEDELKFQCPNCRHVCY